MIHFFRLPPSGQTGQQWAGCRGSHLLVLKRCRSLKTSLTSRRGNGDQRLSRSPQGHNSFSSSQAQNGIISHAAAQLQQKVAPLHQWLLSLQSHISRKETELHWQWRASGSGEPVARPAHTWSATCQVETLLHTLMDAAERRATILGCVLAASAKVDEEVPSRTRRTVSWRHGNTVCVRSNQRAL